MLRLCSSGDGASALSRLTDERTHGQDRPPAPQANRPDRNPPLWRRHMPRKHHHTHLVHTRELITRRWPSYTTHPSFCPSTAQHVTRHTSCTPVKAHSTHPTTRRLVISWCVARASHSSCTQPLRRVASACQRCVAKPRYTWHPSGQRPPRAHLSAYTS